MNRTGNLMASGDGSNAVSKLKKSHKGYYKLAFVEPYDKMTERDIELRQEYAKGAISQYLKVPKEMITFRKKSTNQTIISLDEVFYVKRGVETIGKVSIRVQRLFSSNNMTIIFQIKAIRENNNYKRNSQGSYKKNTKSKTRSKKKRSKDTRKL